MATIGFWIFDNNAVALETPTAVIKITRPHEVAHSTAMFGHLRSPAPRRHPAVPALSGSRSSLWSTAARTSRRRHAVPVPRPLDLAYRPSHDDTSQCQEFKGVGWLFSGLLGLVSGGVTGGDGRGDGGDQVTWCGTGARPRQRRNRLPPARRRSLPPRHHPRPSLLCNLVAHHSCPWSVPPNSASTRSAPRQLAGPRW